jgi:hypothetical protein
MGAKRRMLNTKRGSVTREVLDHFAVAKPTSWDEIQYERAVEAAKQQRAKAQKRSKLQEAA